MSTVASVGPDRFNRLEDAIHGRALSDDLFRTRHFRDGFPQAHVLLFDALVGDGFLHQVRDFIGIERLGDVVVSAILQCGDGGFDRGVPGHHDDDQVGIDLADARRAVRSRRCRAS